MAADLSGVWAKIARADEHFDLLEREIRAFTDRDPQPIGLSIPKFDAESGWFIAYAMEAEPPPPRLGVILGDLVHDTRSALDHLVWQLVILNGATPKRSNTFPLTLTEASWENAIRNGCLQGVSKKHQAIIKRVQPNQGPNGPEDTYTGVLGHLSNIDKHQIVHVTAFIMRDPTQSILIRVTRGPGEVVQWQFHGHANIEHGAELLRVRVEPMTPETEVEVDGGFPLNVAFGDRRCLIGYVKNLPQIARVIVREFEPDFP